MRLIPAFIFRRIEHRPNLLKIVDNIGWLFFDKILRMGLGLLIGVWVARYLGPEQFGLLSFATAFVGLFGAVATLGLQSIVVRNIVQYPSCKNETLGTAAVLQLLAGLVAYVSILLAIFWLRPDDAFAKLIVAILGSGMLFKFSEIALYWFESQVMSKYMVWVQNSCFLVFAGIKVMLILQGAPLIAFAWVILAEAIATALLMVAMFTWRGFKIKSLTVSFEKVKALLLDSWPLMLSGMAIMVYMKIDQIMLGQMLGDKAVGIYSAATRISEVWYFIPTVVVASVFPSILVAKKQSEELYQARTQRLYDLMVWMSVAIALPMTFLAEPIVTLLYGYEFKESSLVLAIHIWTSLFVFLGVASSQWLIAENLQILSLQRTALGAITNIGLNLLLIPSDGAVGAAIATLIAQIVAAFLFDILQKKTRKMFCMKLKAFNPISSLRIKLVNLK
jgi:O-antigen/teichoic acid export membrane protein